MEALDSFLWLGFRYLSQSWAPQQGLPAGNTLALWLIVPDSGSSIWKVWICLCAYSCLSILKVKCAIQAFLFPSHSVLFPSSPSLSSLKKKLTIPYGVLLSFTHRAERGIVNYSFRLAFYTAGFATFFLNYENKIPTT